jgi:hypothetical protein
MRYSLAADATVEWHVRRFEDLHAHRKALYPSGPPRQVSPGEVRGVTVERRFPVPNIHKFTEKYPGVTIAILVKSAWLLMTCHITGDTHNLSRSKFLWTTRHTHSNTRRC